MTKWIQVIVRLSSTERKALRRAKEQTGMTEKAILREAFQRWDAQRVRDLVPAE